MCVKIAFLKPIDIAIVDALEALEGLDEVIWHGLAERIKDTFLVASRIY